MVMNFCQKSVLDIAEGCDFYPAEMGDITPTPPLPSKDFLTPLLLSPSSLLPCFFRCLCPYFSSFHSSLGPCVSFPLHPLLLLPLPLLLLHPSITYPPPHLHTHTHSLYAGRLHRLISPHCDTFGAAACGLLIISTADSRHAPLSPTIQPSHTRAQHRFVLPWITF